MKINIKFFLSLFILCWYSLSCIAQDFKIANNNSSSQISSKDFVDIKIGRFDPANKNCCPTQNIYGKIISASKDSIEVEMKNLIINKDYSKSSTIEFDFDNHNNIQKLSKADILMITNYKQEKGKKFKNFLSGTGAMFFVGGALTTINALAFNKGDNRGKFLLIGGIQVGAGIILGISSGHKNYYFQGNGNPWKFE